jgi:hypothetical protein
LNCMYFAEFYAMFHLENENWICSLSKIKSPIFHLLFLSLEGFGWIQFWSHSLSWSLGSYLAFSCDWDCSEMWCRCFSRSMKCAPFSIANLHHWS